MKRSVASGILAAACALLLTVSASGAQGASPDRIAGWRASLGSGEVTSFAQLQADGAPKAIGVLFSAAALQNLPTEGSDGHHCTDRNGDGVVDRPAECAETHELVVPLPDAVSRRDDVPFKWAL